MNFIAKAKQLYQKYKAAKDYVDAINDLPPTYKSEAEINGFCSGLGMKQIVPDPVSKETIQRKLDKANKAEKAWKDFCTKNNC